MQAFITWYKKSSVVSKLLVLSLKQFCLGYQVVEGVIASRCFNQLKVNLPEGLSAKETKQYIQKNQALLMSQEKNDVMFQCVWLYNEYTKKIDAAWLMALKQSIINDCLNARVNKRQVVCQLVCAWQYEVHQIFKSHERKKIIHDGFVYCSMSKQSAVLLAFRKNKWIHIDISFHGVDHYWVSQQLDTVRSRLLQTGAIHYFCSPTAFEPLKACSKESWQTIG
jgi:hypothetical protein